MVRRTSMGRPDWHLTLLLLLRHPLISSFSATCKTLMDEIGLISWNLFKSYYAFWEWFYLTAFLLWSLWCFNKPPWDRVAWDDLFIWFSPLTPFSLYFMLFNLTLWQMYDKSFLSKLIRSRVIRECHHPTGSPWLMSELDNLIHGTQVWVNFWSEKTEREISHNK